MAAVAQCSGQQVCRQDLHCGDCRTRPYAIAGDPGIPVRRYGTVPPLEDEPAWEVEPLATAEAPRSVGDYGGTAVFLAAAVAAALAGCVLYLH
jgi:hypothetical protein